MPDEHTRTPLEEVLFNAGLIERCQTLLLITPAERTGFVSRLNDKAHVEIEAILS